MLIRLEGPELYSSVLTLFKESTKCLLSVYIIGLETRREILWILKANKSPVTCRECEFEHQRLLSWSNNRKMWFTHSWQADGKKKNEALIYFI